MIHLTDLSNGGQLNGSGQLTGGESAQGSIVRGAIGIEGNCPGDNCLGSSCPEGN